MYIIYYTHETHQHTPGIAALRGDRVATIRSLLKIIDLFCERTLQKRLYSAKETYDFKEPTHRSRGEEGIYMYIHTHDTHKNYHSAGTEMYVHTHTHTRTHICICIYVYICVYIYMCVCMYIFIYIIYTYLYTYIHVTYKHASGYHRAVLGGT